MTQRYGATPDEWLHFDLTLGLTADLLPVVSNPHAKISPKSKMKDTGKTPSVYNREGQVAGIKDWTAKRSTGAQVEVWSQQPDYGICIQCRDVRALDIDVADPQLAGAIAEFLAGESHWEGFPIRSRANSGKCLLALRVPGELGKRRVKVEGGVIEFLANGQQFVAAGTHPSGVRYEWRWPDGMTDFPEYSPEAFEKLWSALVARFGLEDAVVEGAVQRKAKTDEIAVHDPVMEYLADKGLIISNGNEGQAFIECPWKAGHTSDSGETQTAYFGAGTRGYEQGHFKCFHASCAGYLDGDFLRELGYYETDFEVVAGKPTTVIEEPLDKPKYTDYKKAKNKYMATINNLVLALSRPDIVKRAFRHDTFRDEIMVAPYGTEAWEPMQDIDYTKVRLILESTLASDGGQRFEPIAKENLREAVAIVAHRSQFDSAQHWLRSLPEWDGTPRVEEFLPRWFNAANDDYTRAVGRYIWSALAGRILCPGVKADMMPVFEGRQGCRKSSAVEALSPSHEFFTTIDFTDDDSDNARKMRGKLVAEIDELRGAGVRGTDSIKSFLARTHEKWIPKYKEFESVFARRLIMFGTTNIKEILSDSTGNRRWLPVHVDNIDVEGIIENRDQLWAEGRMIYELVGVDWSAEKLAGEAHLEYTAVDPFHEQIATWLETPDVLTGERPCDRPFLRLSEVMEGALGLDIRHQQGTAPRRAGEGLLGAGYVRSQDGHGRKVWRRAAQ